jgi:hypothetical protein
MTERATTNPLGLLVGNAQGKTYAVTMPIFPLKFLFG